MHIVLIIGRLLIYLYISLMKILQFLQNITDKYVENKKLDVWQLLLLKLQLIG
jgi:hypothetical protein